MGPMSAIQKYFRPGQYLFKEGEPSNCMYVIKRGTVAIRKMKGPAYVELGRLYSNEVLGELGFFDRQPRSAAAIALTEVEVLVIQFAQLDKIYHLVPDYLKTIMASVADRLRKANDTIRRLQKNVVTDQSNAFDPSKIAELSSSDVLSAAAALDAGGALMQPGEPDVDPLADIGEDGHGGDDPN